MWSASKCGWGTPWAIDQKPNLKYLDQDSRSWIRMILVDKNTMRQFSIEGVIKETNCTYQDAWWMWQAFSGFPSHVTRVPSFLVPCREFVSSLQPQAWKTRLISSSGYLVCKPVGEWCGHSWIRSSRVRGGAAEPETTVWASEIACSLAERDGKMGPAGGASQLEHVNVDWGFLLTWVAECSRLLGPFSLVLLSRVRSSSRCTVMIQIIRARCTRSGCPEPLSCFLRTEGSSVDEQMRWP